MDNERNWRFRLELTTQLGHMMELYTPNDIREHLETISLGVDNYFTCNYFRRVPGTHGNPAGSGQSGDGEDRCHRSIVINVIKA